MNREHAIIVRDAAQRLPDIEDPSFAGTFDTFGGSKVVLIGGATYVFSCGCIYRGLRGLGLII